VLHCTGLFVLYRMEAAAVSGRSDAFPIVTSGQMPGAYFDLNSGTVVEQEVGEGDAVWQAVPHESGHVYYWNSLTNETSWTLPPPLPLPLPLPLPDTSDPVPVREPVSGQGQGTGTLATAREPSEGPQGTRKRKADSHAGELDINDG
jgi:hypothetical protein